ncbi:MAG: FKBP-type peptidyl-prolyl cis-trans isomerase [Microbacteriaceae bacterium]|nr:FKBP-type peptidyl-prolyl cis-trans isomerase [Microbacteriaceae bacterium]
MSKKFFATIALAGLALSLSACTGSADLKSVSDCKPTAAGASSAKIAATGKVGEAPTVKFPSPLTAKTTERTELIKGKGAVAAAGSTLTVNYTAFNGTTGKKIDSTSYKSDGLASVKLDKSALLPGLIKALTCSAVGARVAVVIPPEDGFGAAGSANLNVGATDALVFVLDVVTVKAAVKESPSPSSSVKALAKADGASQPAPAGFPTVVLDDKGAPTITMPAGAAPAELQIADLKLGTGATVASGDTVTVHYTGAIYSTGSVFDSSWTRGEPASFATTGVIPGFGKALVGHKVGSQVIAVIPPAEGYGAQGSPPKISGTDTLVFVVDILATAK